MDTETLERPGCTCRAAGDPAAYMHDEGCPARSKDPVIVVVLGGEVRRSVPDRIGGTVRQNRYERLCFHISTELYRLNAGDVSGVLLFPARDGVRVTGPDDKARTVDGLAALGLLIELPDGAGTQAAWAALLTLPELT